MRLVLRETIIFRYHFEYSGELGCVSFNYPDLFRIFAHYFFFFAKHNFCDLVRRAEISSETLRLGREEGLKAGRDEGSSMIKKLGGEVVAFSGKNRDQVAEHICLRSDLHAIRADHDTIWLGCDVSRAECGLIRVARR